VRHAEREVARRRLVVELERPARGGLGLLEPPRVAQQIAQAQLRDEVARIELERTPKRRFGFRQTLLAVARLAERRVQQRVVGPAPQGLAQEGLRRRGVAALQVELGELQLQRRVRRSRVGGAARGGKRLLRTAQPQQRRAQALQRGHVAALELEGARRDFGGMACIAGVQLFRGRRGQPRRAAEVERARSPQRARTDPQAPQQLLLQGAASLVQQAELAVDGAEIGVGDDVIGAQAHRVAVAIDRGFELALGVTRGAEVVPRFGVRRMQPQRALVGGKRLLQLAAVLQHVAELVVIRGRLGVARDGLAQRGFGRVELAAAPLHGADDVQRIGRARRRERRFAGERLGLVETLERKAMARAQNKFESHCARF
jgi:hypothetical protein